MTFLAAATNSSLNAVEPGVLGFLIVAGIGVVLVFLLRSMNSHLKKIQPPEEPEERDRAGEQTGDRAESQETSASADAPEAGGAKCG